MTVEIMKMNAVVGVRMVGIPVAAAGWVLLGRFETGQCCRGKVHVGHAGRRTWALLVLCEVVRCSGAAGNLVVGGRTVIARDVVALEGHCAQN